MRRPKYFVSFGGFNLQNVTNVHDENGREITEYDGVGSGKFNVPEARAPHTWKIDCTLEEVPPAAADSWSASEIFKAMDALLENSTQPSRLVVTNSIYPAANLSVLAWFKNYSKDEKEPGTYTTTVELEEYIPVGVKTTDIPYVARPGKVPVSSKVTFSSKNTAYRNYKKTGVGTKTDAEIYKTRAANQEKKSEYLTLKSNGKPAINAATARYDAIYNTKTVQTVNGVTYTSNNDSMAQANLDLVKSAGSAVAKTVSAAGSSIAKAYDSWLVKFKKNNSWLS